MQNKLAPIYAIYINDILWNIQKHKAQAKAEVTRITNKIKNIKKYYYLNGRDAELIAILHKNKPNNVIAIECRPDTPVTGVNITL